MNSAACLNAAGAGGAALPIRWSLFVSCTATLVSSRGVKKKAFAQRRKEEKNIYTSLFVTCNACWIDGRLQCKNSVSVFLFSSLFYSSSPRGRFCIFDVMLCRPQVISRFIAAALLTASQTTSHVVRWQGDESDQVWGFIVVESGRRMESTLGEGGGDGGDRRSLPGVHAWMYRK